jgi:hypothetical protein
MRLRTLIALAGAISLAFTLSCPGLAPAYWTPVNDYTYQIQHVCRDGLIIDLAYRAFVLEPSPLQWPATVTVADPNPPYTYAQVPFQIPRSKTTEGQQMQAAGFYARYLGRNYRVPWATRAPGSMMWVKVVDQDYYLRTVEDCSINTRFDPFNVGYVWAHIPYPPKTTPTYTYNPDQFWSYNSTSQITSQTNWVSKIGPGAYTVGFPGLAGPAGNAQVTAYGEAARVCKLATPPWTVSGSAILLNVRCFDPKTNGGPADAQFTASYRAGYGMGTVPYAFAFADQPSNPNTYPPNLAYQYNNTGGRITIKRQSVGKYMVYIPDNLGGFPAGSVKVTAAGATSTDCNIGSFYGFWNMQYVEVRCFAGNGLPADSYFSIVFMDGMNHLGSNIMADGYARTDTDWPPERATYSPQQQLWLRSTTSSDSGKVAISREQYMGPHPPYYVWLPFQHTQRAGSGASWDGGTVHATAYGVNAAGADNLRCQVGAWFDSMWDTWEGDLSYRQQGRMVTVYCFEPDGDRALSKFTLQYTGKLPW